ncbi:PhaM family polyhydroxyalkanoate granule multifunctional regulatory protein [Achromobacter animicus]|uniref:PhaM family polyhydroxyalkanoate granule multifunctional regulatory protein n=1 Tax=Achromobacter animicus TaxID=1389935 RepID=UPI00244B8854|nr:PhaM family polyhydroxyalkanoate granule multifunctional regulatory protein [Achromobacter animicus]MDH0686207.1 transcriptional regulator [Achromobacter animicus]
MSDQYNNPFVLPGMGQSSDLSGNPLLASMEMMRQAWAGLTGPGGLASSLPMAPPMNLEDLDRRIAELRSVENWLRMNLSMLSSTIQGMEVQRSTISTLRAFVDSASRMDMGASQDGAAASPLEVALGLKPAPKTAGSASAASAQSSNATPSSEKENAAAQSGVQPEGAGASAGSGPESAAAMSEQMGAAAQSASKAWWDLLQQQFNQIAAATAASMPAGAPGAAGAPDAAKSKSKSDSETPKASAQPDAKTGKPPAKPAAARKPAAAKRTAKTAKKNGPADGKP